MTCIVAIKKDGIVYMGADSAGIFSCSFDLMVRNDPKIYQVGEFLFGFTGSFRMGQLLGYSMPKLIKEEAMPIHQFMVTTFIDTVRQVLKDGGFASKKDENESGGTFLVGYRGHLFCVEGDYQVGEVAQDYCAVGCGAQIALGSLCTSSYHDLLIDEPEQRLRIALEAAQEFSAGVRAPFIFRSIGE
jgi:ATP-dependent protease HslVU (ClpYQ) peptidase subunit